MLLCNRCHLGWLAVLNQTKYTWAPTKRHCSLVEVVLVRKWAALLGFAEIVGTCPPVWMHMILTKTNMLSTVEGSRLPLWGCTRCITTFTCNADLTPWMSWDKEPLVICAFPFYSCRSHDLACAGMHDITHYVTMSFHDVMSWKFKMMLKIWCASNAHVF